MVRFKFTTDQQKYNIMALKLLNKILVYNLYYFSTINLLWDLLENHLIKFGLCTWNWYSEGKDWNKSSATES
jgi:hypothetical protein